MPSSPHHVPTAATTGCEIGAPHLGLAAAVLAAAIQDAESGSERAAVWLSGEGAVWADAMGAGERLRTLLGEWERQERTPYQRMMAR